jgi:TetR/AcrR family transcriptional regulator, transcriptional repressor for nem operon
MARKKEFDRGLALHKAIRLFSQQGYAATSTDDLMRVMGIGRQSMYDTFGDKKELFLAALESYVRSSCARLSAELEKPGRPLDVIRNAIVAFAERKDMVSSEGCMGLNSISEFGLRDKDVNAVIRSAAHSQRTLILRLLKEAVETGDLKAEQLNAAADFIDATLAGIRYAAKAGKDRKALRELAVFAGTALGNPGRIKAIAHLL